MSHTFTLFQKLKKNVNAPGKISVRGDDKPGFFMWPNLQTEYLLVSGTTTFYKIWGHTAGFVSIRCFFKSMKYKSSHILNHVPTGSVSKSLWYTSTWSVGLPVPRGLASHLASSQLPTRHYHELLIRPRMEIVGAEEEKGALLFSSTTKRLTCVILNYRWLTWL